MRNDTIEGIMGIDLDTLNQRVIDENERKRQARLEKNSFEFSLKDLEQTNQTIDFALLPDSDFYYRNGFFLNTLTRDGIAYERLNATRGRMKPDSGLTREDAKDLAAKTRNVLQDTVKTNTTEHDARLTPDVIRVHLDFDTMVEAYAQALTTMSPKFAAYMQNVYDELGRLETYDEDADVR